MRPIHRSTVMRMESVTVPPELQIVMPQSVRDRLGIKVGERVHVLSYRNLNRCRIRIPLGNTSPASAPAPGLGVGPGNPYP
jgi:bifunctional DNA-binding transcriptional regulator/antitoxin component of YhaV-PrlF toxin-antitoxin module